VDEAALRGRLLEHHGLEIGAGLGALAGKIWRIGLMGYSSRAENVLLCLGALGTELNQMGHGVDTSAALTAAEAALDAFSRA
jgi:alanine-glyoxylate transaminase/serine-glyoxylate transaminase/serine-pyruvate transaminase